MLRFGIVRRLIGDWWPASWDNTSEMDEWLDWIGSDGWCVSEKGMSLCKGGVKVATCLWENIWRCRKRWASSSMSLIDWGWWCAGDPFSLSSIRSPSIASTMRKCVEFDTGHSLPLWGGGAALLFYNGNGFGFLSKWLAYWVGWLICQTAARMHG